MGYEQVQKPSSSFVPVQKKVSGFAPPVSRVQAKDVTAGEQEQIPLGSTPATDANWLMKHPLFKGNQFLQRVVAPASESLESEESLAQRETVQRQEEGNESGTPNSLPLQAKLTIGEPGDKYEQEADRVASQVVKQINSPEAASSSQGQSVQRQEEPVEELQRQPSISNLQRSPLPLEVQREVMPAEEELQAKSILQGREAIAGGEASTDLDSAINSARGSGQPLEAGLQRSMGQAMGADFSGVKVHTDAQSDQLNQSIQAKAFTTGQDVFFRQGAYEPGSRGGQELIAHELTHVVQQSGITLQRFPDTSTPVQQSPQNKAGARTLSKVSQHAPHGILIQADFWEKTSEGQYKWHSEEPDKGYVKLEEMRNGTGKRKKDVFEVYKKIQQSQNKQGEKGATKTSSPSKGSQAKEPSTASHWSAEEWDVPTMKKAAETLIEKYSSGKGMNKVRSSLEALNNYQTDEIINRMKQALNNVAETGVECPIESVVLEEQSKKADNEKAIAAEALKSLREIDPSTTKKYKRNPQSFEVSKEGSAVERLKAKNNKLNPWTKQFIEALKEEKNLFRQLVAKGPLFYGTTEGQRIHVLAARFIKDKGIKEIDPVDLMNEVTKELDSGAKENWPEVSNFWLAGDVQSGVGLVGERSKGLEARQQAYQFSELYKGELELLQGIIDLKVEGSDKSIDVKKEFIKQFHAEQAALGKDWYEDINRHDYQHKPGHGSSKNKQDNEILMYEDLICRRMCKWMLHVAHIGDQPVIYSLDEIDLSSVSEAKTLEINDTVSNTGSKKMKVPVCTSELREIFRSLDKFESERPEKGVKFFKELMPEPAPWNENRTEQELKPWAEYALHLTKKLLINYPGDTVTLERATEMVKACKTQQWQAVIKNYKNLKPSELRDQGAAVTTKDKRGSEQRKELEKTKHNQGSILTEVLGVVKALEECILDMNGKKAEVERKEQPERVEETKKDDQ